MSTHSHSLNAGQVRASIDPAARKRSVFTALCIVLPCYLLYAGMVAATIAVPFEWARPILSVLTGLVSTLLFLQAHDAGHDSLTPHRWLNGLIGRILFLPSWHPFSGWVHAHNHVHHGWTNFVLRDYAWAPMSKVDYDRFPHWRQAMIRLYRWWPGFGLYYGWEVLFLKSMLPQPEVRSPKQRRVWWFDVAFLIAGTVALGAITAALGKAWGVPASPAWLIFWVQVVPFMIAMWLVGFITYLHHTNPQIAWFKDPEEWSFYCGQVLGTTHTRFPSRISYLIHNIMEHTAHHVDQRIPLYNLPAAQAALETTYHEDIVDPVFSWRSFFYAQRVCQLYDFENHRWQNYRGEHTSSRTFRARPTSAAPSESPAALSATP